MSLPARPSSGWLVAHGYASYPVDRFGARIPGVGVSKMPSPQEVAYVENVGHAPPASDSPQWTWKKKKGGPSSAEMAVAA